MKRIKILPAIQLRSRDGSEVLDDKQSPVVFHYDKWLWAVLDGPVFRESVRALKIGQDIELAYKKAKDEGLGSFVVPETPHHEMLVRGIEPASAGQDGRRGTFLVGAWNALPFINAVLNAEEDPPLAVDAKPKEA